MAPIILPANQPPARPYKGGQQIADFRGTKYEPNTSEDWIASTTCCGGCSGNGRLFADVVADQPEYWLGTDHVKAFGVDTKVLVKLLDAGERLFVHAHPHADWAREHVGAAHGKAEAWLILTPGVVHLGLKEDITHDDLLQIVEEERGAELLTMMHRLEVQPFDCVYVAPGTLHATGEGILLVEVQEPEDLSVLCEWKGYGVDGAKDGHFGLGFPVALTAVNRKGWSTSELGGLVTTATAQGSVVEQAKRYFDIDRVKVDGEEKCRRGFAVLIVCSGEMNLEIDDGSATSVAKGDTLVIPHGDGDFSVQGKGEIILVRPPVPQ
ncbi:hypothetical protein LTR37_003868 [Vermiconidia calcicola]|uniref:Uncharacterized protein n=1 Tax=Vermiconidia calcicola TaxID=1690605 RepID=A0ACC3NPF2_9PEZI|nr:hypothetical protein LTR37_003868 [Vermiconidia calcicola]